MVTATTYIIEWLKNIDREENCLVIKFKIKNFNPLVSRTIFSKAYKFNGRNLCSMDKKPLLQGLKYNRTLKNIR